MAATKSHSISKSAMKENLDKECPNCESRSIVRDYHRNIEICENCGRIIKDKIKDRGPEWRAFDQEEKENKSRAGPPSTETVHDKGLSTQIDRKNRDIRGKSLSPKKNGLR